MTTPSFIRLHELECWERTANTLSSQHFEDVDSAGASDMFSRAEGSTDDRKYARLRCFRAFDRLGEEIWYISIE